MKFVMIRMLVKVGVLTFRFTGIQISNDAISRSMLLFEKNG